MTDYTQQTQEDIEEKNTQQEQDTTDNNTTEEEFLEQKQEQDTSNNIIQEQNTDTTTQSKVSEEQTLVEEESKVPTSGFKTQQKGFTPVYKVELDLTNYAEAMDKEKAINPEEGGRWQYSLYTTIKDILNAKDQEEFNKEWNTVLTFFNKNKDGIFNENFIYRFPEHWPGSATEYTTFRRIIHVILQTADVKNRKKTVESIKFDMVTEHLTEDQKNKLFAFYNV